MNNLLQSCLIFRNNFMHLEFLLLNSHREYFSLVYSFLHFNAKPLAYYSGSQLGIPRPWDLKCDFQE